MKNAQGVLSRPCLQSAAFFISYMQYAYYGNLKQSLCTPGYKQIESQQFECIQGKDKDGTFRAKTLQCANDPDVQAQMKAAMAKPLHSQTQTTYAGTWCASMVQAQCILPATFSDCGGQATVDMLQNQYALGQNISYASLGLFLLEVPC